MGTFSKSFASMPSTITRVRALMRHRDFTLKNPNRARSLISAFCLRNPGAFHRADGAGYAFWADRVIELDALVTVPGELSPSVTLALIECGPPTFT